MYAFYKKMPGVVYLIIALALTSIEATAQSFQDNYTVIREVPTTPTMWEFQKYGDYPVSMHTGVPEISIPLEVARSGDLEIPVSLSYHASGIKVDQKATWVGLGWELIAGGAITRTVRGSTDEGDQGYIDNPYYTQGTFNPATGNNYVEIEEMMQGWIDTEPDLFYYNFMGYSGRFVFNHSVDRTTADIVLIPHNDLKIEPIFNQASISGFTITTPEGHVAEFDYAEVSSEYRDAGLIGASTITATSTWHLKKITAPNGVDNIEFEYKQIQVTVTDERYSEIETIDFGDPCNPSNPTAISGKQSNNNVNYTGVKRLEKITFRNGYFLFQSSSGNRLDLAFDEDFRMDRMEVYQSQNGVNTLIKSFDFDYDYFGVYDQISRSVRLKLEKVTEKGINGAVKNPYEFSYVEAIGNVGMPSRFSTGQDYWGYFNGANSNPSLVPQYTQSNGGNNYTMGDANRDVNSQYAQMGIIQSITYPTLGKTEFEFESNTASIFQQGSLQQFTTGGLRIKSITNKDHDGSTEWVKSYEYIKPDNALESSGVYNGASYVEPRDFFSAPINHFASLQVGSCQPQLEFTHYETNTWVMSTTPNLAKNLANVFYSAVKEYQGTPTNHAGYSWYHYDTTKDTAIQVTGPGAYFTLDRSWDRGQLLLQENFVNGNTTPISSVQNVYEEVVAATPVSGFKPGTFFSVQSLGYVPPTGGWTPEGYRSQQYFLTYYEEASIWKRLDSTITINDGVETIQTFTYDLEIDHINVVESNTVSSRGRTWQTKNYYPDDITSASSLPEGGPLTSAEYTVIDKLKKDDLHRPATPIQTTTKVDGSVTSVQRILYDDFENITLPSTIQFGKEGNLEDRVTYEEYSDGRPIQVSKVDGSPITYLWGYSNQYVIAKIENASFGEVATALGVSTAVLKTYDEDNINQINSLRTVLSEALITTYNHDPLIGVSIITNPHGYRHFFTYDNHHRLMEIRDHNNRLISDYQYHYKNPQ